MPYLTTESDSLMNQVSNLPLFREQLVELVNKGYLSLPANHQWNALLKSEATARKTVVCIGDSWLDYATSTDIFKEIGKQYRAIKIALRGTALRTIAHGRTQTDAPRFPGKGDDFLLQFTHCLTDNSNNVSASIRAIVLSASGNDVVDDGQLEKLVNVKQPGSSPLNASAVDTFINDPSTGLAAHLRKTLTRIMAATALIKDYQPCIYLHGYDYPIPNGNGAFYIPIPGFGPWLKEPLERKGYTDLEERKAIMHALINQLNEMQIRVANEPAWKGCVVHVDLRGSLKPAQWGNELHPTEEGFKIVAAKFLDLIQRQSP
jgi:hypothetical protein